MTPLLPRVLRASTGATPPGEVDPGLADALRGPAAARLPELAGRHGLSGYLAWALGRSGVELPGPAQAQLARAAFGSRVKAQRIRTLTVDALGALAQAEIVPVALKGAALAARIYPDPLTRLSTDVDLWVSPEQLEPAARLLRGLGLAEAGTSAADEDDPQAHHRTFAGPRGVVELHFRALSTFGAPVEGAEAFGRAVDAVLEGHRYRHLAPEDELAYLALHAAHHLLQRLTWLLDLALFVSRAPLDWPRVVRACQATGHPELCHLALDTARRTLGAQIPPAALEPLCPARWKQLLASRVLFTEARLTEAFLATHKPAWAAAKLALGVDRAGVLRLFARRLRERLGERAGGE